MGHPWPCPNLKYRRQHDTVAHYHTEYSTSCHTSLTELTNLPHSHRQRIPVVPNPSHKSSPHRLEDFCHSVKSHNFFFLLKQDCAILFLFALGLDISHNENFRDSWECPGAWPSSAGHCLHSSSLNPTPDAMAQVTKKAHALFHHFFRYSSQPSHARSVSA